MPDKREDLYPVKVGFKRTFVRGALKGRTINDEIGFPDQPSAQSWINGVRRHLEIHSATIIRKDSTVVQTA